MMKWIKISHFFYAFEQEEMNEEKKNRNRQKKKSVKLQILWNEIEGHIKMCWR